MVKMANIMLCLYYHTFFFNWEKDINRCFSKEDGIRIEKERCLILLRCFFYWVDSIKLSFPHKNSLKVFLKNFIFIKQVTVQTQILPQRNTSVRRWVYSEMPSHKKYPLFSQWQHTFIPFLNKCLLKAHYVSHKIRNSMNILLNKIVPVLLDLT